MTLYWIIVVPYVIALLFIIDRILLENNWP